MELLFFRHGPAGDKAAWARKGRPDEERPLTRDGADKTRKAADGLASLVASLDLIVSSPLARAVQTADRLAKAFPKARRLVLDELAPGSVPKALFERLRGLDAARLALVGHEPHMSSAIAAALGASGLALELKKAGACLVDWDPAKGRGRLLWLLRPSQLRDLR